MDASNMVTRPALLDGGEGRRVSQLFVENPRFGVSSAPSMLAPSGLETQRASPAAEAGWAPSALGC
jgi:hypothetical protein